MILAVIQSLNIVVKALLPAVFGQNESLKLPTSKELNKIDKELESLQFAKLISTEEFKRIISIDSDELKSRLLKNLTHIRSLKEMGDDTLNRLENNKLLSQDEINRLKAELDLTKQSSGEEYRKAVIYRNNHLAIYRFKTLAEFNIAEARNAKLLDLEQEKELRSTSKNSTELYLRTKKYFDILDKKEFLDDKVSALIEEADKYGCLPPAAKMVEPRLIRRTPIGDEHTSGFVYSYKFRNELSKQNDLYIESRFAALQNEVVNAKEYDRRISKILSLYENDNLALILCMSKIKFSFTGFTKEYFDRFVEEYRHADEKGRLSKLSNLMQFVSSDSTYKNLWSLPAQGRFKEILDNLMIKRVEKEDANQKEYQQLFKELFNVSIRMEDRANATNFLKPIIEIDEILTQAQSHNLINAEVRKNLEKNVNDSSLGEARKLIPLINAAENYGELVRDITKYKLAENESDDFLLISEQDVVSKYQLALNKYADKIEAAKILEKAVNLGVCGKEEKQRILKNPQGIECLKEARSFEDKVKQREEQLKVVVQALEYNNASVDQYVDFVTNESTIDLKKLEAINEKTRITRESLFFALNNALINSKEFIRILNLPLEERYTAASNYIRLYQDKENDIDPDKFGIQKITDTEIVLERASKLE